MKIVTSKGEEIELTLVPDLNDEQEVYTGRYKGKDYWLEVTVVLEKSTGISVTTSLDQITFHQ